MHSDELWQEYNAAGERLDSGRPPERGNPKLDEQVYVANASIWLYRHTEQGIEVLFQKRSQYVDRNANYFDRSAGGHINLGEKNIDAVIRETKEEIGAKISPENVYFIASTTSNHANIFVNVYACDYTNKSDDFHFDDREVSEVKWVALSEFDEFIEKYAKPPLRADKESNTLFKKWLEQRGNH